MNAASKSNALLEVAREDFPAFYTRSTARDRHLMDSLVLLTALSVRINADRAAMEPETAQRMLEETRTAIQQAFSELRDRVRAFPSVADLPTVERWKIESAIFERSP